MSHRAEEVLQEYRIVTADYMRFMKKLRDITPPAGGVESLPKIESLSDLYE